jgi:dihydroorotase
MSKEYEDIRDLIRKIEEVGKEHQAWSMCHEVVYTATNNLRAVAQYMECRDKLEEVQQFAKDSAFALEEIEQYAKSSAIALEKERNKSFAQYVKEKLFRGLFNGE